MSRRNIILVFVVLLLLISCGEKEKIVEVPVPVDCPPSAPRGVFSINLSDRVTIVWYPNPESDVEGYDVYRGESLYGDYYYIGTVEDVDPDPFEYYYDDTDVVQGRQFFYAVAAYDRNGNESELSYEEVSGTPRPEGIVTLYDLDDVPERSGYDLSSKTNTAQRYDLPTTDFYFDRGVDNVARLVCARAGVDIQDYGFVDEFDIINRSPVEGWSPTGQVEAIPGHVYIFRVLESDGTHYAKVGVIEVTSQSVSFIWAYQVAPGNRDLAPGKVIEQKKGKSKRNEYE